MPNSKDTSWFHGKKSRQEAEEILKNHGLEEGLFLVRNSSSCQGDFVLSVVVKNEIIHYQIQRRQKDALFSLSEETKVIHGLDELIFYYQNQPQSGLQHSLNNFVPGDDCPNSVKLHGAENLLHRATKAGNFIVVEELLKCGDRDIAAKDHDGMCALHLAAFFGYTDIVELLIQYGANVDVTNSSGE